MPEYGRTFCEAFGTDLTMEDLVTIARTHHALTEAALRQCDRRLILDTDPLMTCAWADMLFGRRDPWFAQWRATADLYLLLEPDIDWVDDGTRFFGGAAERARFHDFARVELERRGVPFAVVGGMGDARFENALAAIEVAGLGGDECPARPVNSVGDLLPAEGRDPD